MIEWITVLALIFSGIGLIIVEILFVPGTTIVGAVGLLATGVGVYLGFDYFGQTTGWWIFTGTSISFAIALYLSFKGKTWEKFSLKDAIQSKVNEGLTSELKEGDEGKALSALRPMGKAEFNDQEFEVRSFGNYIESGTMVTIVKIEGNSIYVEQIDK